jgi:enoyl-CoA hydratase/carnithine racemase
MAPGDPVLVSRVDSAIRRVTINRPPHNFIEFGILAGIADAYEQIATDPEARVIILTAVGKNFCAGANFGGVQRDAAGSSPPESRFDATGAYAEGARIMAAPLPVIAVIRGAAVGGGFGLACTADFRVGSAETRLAPNFAQLGIHHGLGLTVTLPLIVGWQRANELLLTGRRVRGEEGYTIGLLDRFVRSDELEAAAIAFAEEIAASGPLAVRAMRATMRQGLAERFRAATEQEAREQARLSATQDFREGVRASSERRRPQFTGR